MAVSSKRIVIGAAILIVAALLARSMFTVAPVHVQVARATSHVPENFRYLTYYVFSEVPPPEKPATTVLRAMRDIPEGSVQDEIVRVANAFDLDPNYLKAVAKIESDFDPHNRTGSYIGLFQLSQNEFSLYGDGDILDARDNAIAAAYKILVEAHLFELETHRHATLSDLYLIHQQGVQGAEQHVEHPGRIAWQSMCATDEGKAKGAGWCRLAIWGNTLPDIKSRAGSVENLTSGAFVDMWSHRLMALLDTYSAVPSAAAAEASAPAVVNQSSHFAVAHRVRVYYPRSHRYVNVRYIRHRR